MLMERVPAVTQEQVDALCERIRKLVKKHGADSLILKSVRNFYAIQSRGIDQAGWTFLECAVEEAEEVP